MTLTPLAPLSHPTPTLPGEGGIDGHGSPRGGEGGGERGSLVPLLTLLLTLISALPAWTQEARLVDRIVAVVDEAPIFYSDIRRAIELGLARPADGESPTELERRILDDLIDQRLRLREVDRFGTGTSRIEEDDIERQLSMFRERFGGQEGLDARLAEVGLDENGLRHLVTQQLRVLRYVDERLGPRVFVDLADIRAYHENELTPELRKRDIPVPALEEVREGIRMLLRERRLDWELEAWTRKLRLEADIVDHFDRVDEELPPVVRRIE